MSAAFNGNADRVRSLIASGAAVNTKDSNGNTALMCAVHNGNVDSVNALIAAGADMRVTDNNGLTLLMGAAVSGKAGCVKALIDAGADVNANGPSGFTALMWAGNASCVRVLVHAHANVNASIDGYTALMSAARFGRADCVRALLAAHANVNARDCDDETAIYYGRAFPDIVTALEAVGGTNPMPRVGVHARDGKGMTSLMKAADAGDVDRINALVAKGADVNARGPNGQTVLELAKDHPDAVAALKAAGSKE